MKDCIRTKLKKLKVIMTIFAVTALPYINIAQAQQYIDEFHQKLRNTYGQADDYTVTHQIIYASLEAIAAYKLGSLVTKVDTKAIQSISSQIKSLQDRSGMYSEPMSEAQRQVKLRQLKRELKIIEGGMAKRAGRGVAKFLIRGAQVLLVLDLGLRVYILATLPEENPRFFPGATLFCSEVDCPVVINQIIEASNKPFRSAQERNEQENASDTNKGPNPESQEIQEAQESPPTP